jgi:mannonate dehydratase
MKFIYSWRWFGPSDRITLKEIRQAGAEAIVTALHQVPVGETWTEEAVAEREKTVEDAGLTWTVVESLPVSEEVKRRSGPYRRHIENYRASLRNLAANGIRTVVYNFMPLLDWSRTDLNVVFKDGSRTSGFRLVAFAAFDLFILKRPGAENDYPPDAAAEAEAYFRSLDDGGIRRLQETVLYGLPGSMQTYSLYEFRRHLTLYRSIDRDGLKEHLRSFLKEVVPVAEECGIRLAVHPDDPPWALLGLPRIAGTLEDLREITAMADSPSNGITLCTGSLGAGHFNDLTRITGTLAPFIHFVHLRNVSRDAGLNFQEETLFEGDVDVIGVVRGLVEEGLRIEKRTGKSFSLPIRPDHGHQMLDEIGKENYPGYSLYGRMKNLAEIKGLTLGVIRLMEDGESFRSAATNPVD